MATNVKKKKKRSTYDDKLIKIIAISLAVIIIGIVGAILVIDFTGDHVGWVGWNKIYDYEYERFLSVAADEMRANAVEEGILKENATAEEIEAFWTSERETELKDLALDKARVWKAEYILAKNADCDLTRKEKSNYATNIENEIYSTWYQSYSSYYEYEDFKAMYCGNMDWSEFKKFMYQEAAIYQYKEKLKEAYSATDDELRAIYDKDPDDYRLVSVRKLVLAKPTVPTAVEEPVKPEIPTKDDGTEITSEDTETEYAEKYTAYQTELTKYNEDLEKYNTYKTEYDNYITSLSALSTRANGILTALNDNGVYSEEADLDEDGNIQYEQDENGEDKVDEDGNKIKAMKYENADFATIIKTESAESSVDTSGGLSEINNESVTSYTAINEYALQHQWSDENKNSFSRTVTEESETEGEEPKTTTTTSLGATSEDGKITYTKIELIEDDNYIYLARCEYIEDFDNSVESSEGANDSVKDHIQYDLFEERAEEELIGQVASAGDKYKVSIKKESVINKVFKTLGI